MIRNAMQRTMWIGLTVAAHVFSLTPVHAQVSPAQSRITPAVNNADRVTLTGSMRKSLTRAKDLGAANPIADGASRDSWCCSAARTGRLRSIST